MGKTKFDDLQSTDGAFQLKGVVTGVAKDNFYQEKTDKNGNPFRMINFGLQTSKESVLYLSLNGLVQKEAFFYNKDAKDAKDKTMRVPWNNRLNFSREGYRLIGVNLGIQKTLDEKGNEVNDKRTLTPFDACEYISTNLKDGMSVFVRGKLEFSSFKNQKGEVQRSAKMIPNQISLCKEVDFDEEGFVPVSDFTQPILFMGVEYELNEDKSFKQAELDTMLVNYNSIEQYGFVIEDGSLAKLFKKNLTPYTYIKTWGTVSTVRNTEEVETESEGWGSENKMDVVRSPYQRIFVVTGADPTSIDTKEYSESKIEKALQSLKEESKEKEQFKTQETDWGDSPIDDEEETGW